MSCAISVPQCELNVDLHFRQGQTTWFGNKCFMLLASVTFAHAVPKNGKSLLGSEKYLYSKMKNKSMKFIL